MSNDILALDAFGLAAAYERGELSPVDAVKASLAQIQTCEPALNAVYMTFADRALAQAGDAEKRWRAGEPLSRLDGVPLTLKDNIATAGDPLPIGSGANDPPPVASADSPPAARLAEAGCILVAKTTMPDFGMLGSGVSSFHGTTRNPWDLAANPWGSSSGAGAATAACYTPLALGTDIGGSVRMPAAACGLVGHKPSLGRVPIHPPFLARVTGPMTRSVRDSCQLMTHLSRPDSRDYMNLPPIDTSVFAEPRIEIKGLKLGLLLDIGIGLPVDAEVRSAIEAAATMFADAGAEIVPVEPFFTTDMATALDRFFRIRSWTDISRMSEARQERVLPFILEWAQASEGFDGKTVMDALNHLFAMREAAVNACTPYDFVLAPTIPIVSYSADLPCPTNDPDRPFEHLAFTAPFNQSEQPASSIACAMSRDGLPIGLHIIGQRFDDQGVLAMTHAYEQMRGFTPAWPMSH